MENLNVGSSVDTLESLDSLFKFLDSDDFALGALSFLAGVLTVLVVQNISNSRNGVGAC